MTVPNDPRQLGEAIVQQVVVIEAITHSDLGGLQIQAPSEDDCAGVVVGKSASYVTRSCQERHSSIGRVSTSPSGFGNGRSTANSIGDCIE